MNDYSSQPEQEQHYEQLTAEDIAILQAFEERDAWTVGPLQAPVQEASSLNDELDEMLMVFASEIDEDITRLRHALSQLEQNDTLDLSRFTPIRRIAHKIRGTAGSVNYEAIAAIGTIIEEIVIQVMQHLLFPLVGMSILVQAIHALEMTLQSLLETGQESLEPLKNLENELVQLNIPHLASSQDAAPLPPQHEPQENQTSPDTSATSASPIRPSAQLFSSLRVDEARFQQLVQDAEQLAEQRTPLENAQTQLQDALQELHLAQNYLQQQRTVLDRLPTTFKQLPASSTELSHSDHPVSSLIARVLNHTAQQTTDGISSTTPYLTQTSRARHTLHRSKLRLLNVDDVKDERWDELEITRYTDLDETLHTISDAISHVLLASSRVQSAYSHLSMTLQRYVSRAATLRDNALILRMTPVSVLVEHLQHVINASAMEQKRQTLIFEVKGEKTELDSTILETLASPLTALLHTCLADNTAIQDQPPRGWLHVQSIGNEILLELGFSMTVQGGALEMVQNAVRQVGGTLALQRNEQGGVSFLLYVPRTQGTLRGLLVRVGKQPVIVPFSQVQQIDDEKHAELDITYHLHRLLDIAHEEYPKQQTTPILVLPKGISRLIAGVLVDEVLTDVEVMVKPLPGYLQRPGITSAAIDGKGNVQLVLNLPELIRHYNTVLRHTLHTLPEHEETPRPKTTPRVLIADDSLAIRQSILQTLSRAHYETAEASDGMEALEQLTKNPPDIFLLDMEMPNLSGYDVLSIMHLYHELNNVKVIMLTSRSSEKHRRHALELGAHAYLTKPCMPEVLLETIEKLLS